MHEIAGSARSPAARMVVTVAICYTTLLQLEAVYGPADVEVFAVLDPIKCFPSDQQHKRST